MLCFGKIYLRAFGERTLHPWIHISFEEPFEREGLILIALQIWWLWYCVDRRQTTISASCANRRKVCVQGVIVLSVDDQFHYRRWAGLSEGILVNSTQMMLTIFRDLGISIVAKPFNRRAIIELFRDPSKRGWPPLGRGRGYFDFRHPPLTRVFFEKWPVFEIWEVLFGK